MYMTSALSKNDMKAIGLQMALDLLAAKEQRDSITGLRTRTQPGRPDWSKVRAGSAPPPKSCSCKGNHAHQTCSLGGNTTGEPRFRGGGCTRIPQPRETSPSRGKASAMGAWGG